MNAQRTAAGAAVLSLAILLLWAGLPVRVPPEPVAPIKIITPWLPTEPGRDDDDAPAGQPADGDPAPEGNGPATDADLESAGEGSEECAEQSDDETCV